MLKCIKNAAAGQSSDPRPGLAQLSSGPVRGGVTEITVNDAKTPQAVVCNRAKVIFKDADIAHCSNQSSLLTILSTAEPVYIVVNLLSSVFFSLWLT